MPAVPIGLTAGLSARDMKRLNRFQSIVAGSSARITRPVLDLLEDRRLTSGVDVSQRLHGPCAGDPSAAFSKDLFMEHFRSKMQARLGHYFRNAFMFSDLSI